jgi:ankyrin repeat protein
MKKSLLILSLLISTHSFAVEETPIMDASWECNNSELVRLISAGANVNEVNGYGDSPLIYTIKNCDLKTVNILINAGANINLRIEDKYTPLHLAIALNKLKISSTLICNGADTGAESLYGQKPIDMATTNSFEAELVTAVKNECNKEIN